MRKVAAPFAAAITGLLLACGGAEPGDHPGEQIAFTSCRAENPEDDESYPICDIFVVNANGSGLTRLSELPAFNPQNDNPYAAWSPDGNHIAFAFPQEFDSDIYVMHADGSDQKNLTNSPDADDRRPFWSPDGRRIAFLSDRDDPNEGILAIYVMNADGSGVLRLTQRPGSWDFAPGATIWSPDSSQIVFRSHDGIIYVLAVDGSGLTRVPNIDGSEIGWSPDGSRIAFISSVDIYVVSPDGSGLTNLTNGAFDYVLYYSWSPDGSRIAFMASREGNQEIYVVNVDGSGLRNVTNNPADDTLPAWSPDGSRIAFLSDRSDSEEAPRLYVMNADGSGVARLSDSPAARCCRPAWQPPPR